ncbi:ATP-binding protein [Variovorax sp. J2P1-59]|uniref:PAS domain-containing hybrid sensor histidine kinase/response regulator n=1 Tax=Variovorax flavidus TaxID=3053501 RepID=UPI00257528C4|nr:ATP-binding protein [Variovorax sp. J2P1-59]MDM0074982.1 ATP-binding protein [Variovorax sp. J2P1-59]
MLPESRVVNSLGGGLITMALTCLLGGASYFFGQPMAIELHWVWTALGSLCIIGLAILQFVRARNVQRRDDQLNAILDAVPHILFFKDRDFRYRALNAEFVRVFNLDARAAVGKNDEELFGPELQDRFVAQDMELISSGEARTFDEEIQVDGVLRSIQARKRPVYDRSGKLCGTVGLAIDVTEQKLLQRQLEEAHARLDMALEGAQMGTWEWNVTTGEVHTDERAKRILGLKGSAHDLSAVFARVHPDDVGDITRRIDHLSHARRDVEAVEFRVLDDLGAERWVEGFASPNRVRSGKVYVVGVTRDITERRTGELAFAAAKARADRALSELDQFRSNLELALIVGGMGVWRSVTRMGKDTQLSDSTFMDTVITADQKIREIYGHEPDAVITYRDQVQLLHPEDRDRVAANIQATYRQNSGAYRDQFRIRSRSGVVRTLDVRGILRVASEGHGDALLVSFTGIAKDISEEERLKADLVAKAEEARLAVEAKRAFLAMISHEVRTPLNGVLGMIELVLDSPLATEQRAMLDRCRESSLELLTIINDLLDYSKIRARKLDLENRPLQLAALVEDVCANFIAETRLKSVSLHSRVDPQLPLFIIGDPVRLRQVLTNLVGNAVKFTERGGVKVEVRRSPDARLQMIIEDSGIGIAREAMDALFEPFAQADITTTRRYGGTGLGLTIVKQLVDLMQGTIECDSEPGRGSRFTVTLPLQPYTTVTGSATDEVPIESGKRGVHPIGRGQKLLLAEDHPINREVITRQLVKLGFQCDCAEDGEEAWELLTSPNASYAMLLTDCHMPRLDGYGLTRRLRDFEMRFGLQRLPTIALTANALPGEAERCVAAGMDGYLSKPLQIHVLRDELAKFMPPPTQVSNAAPSAAEPPEATESMGSASADAYPTLASLCKGDTREVAKLLRLFVDATSKDLDAMDRATEVCDHVTLRQLAHRLSSACHQLDETKAVTLLQVIEQLEETGGAVVLAPVRALYVMARQEVASALARASEFIDRA